MALRILVVDDHEPVRRAITSILAKRPDWHVCGEASDGIEAIARAKELRPDAVLMDVSMPKMDGLQAAQAVRQVLPGTKVILVSQNDPSVVREQAAQARAHAYVGKDAIAKELIPSIERLFCDVASNSDADLSMRPAREEVSTWLPGGGEMRELIRQTDWARTPLGETTSWSPALRMIVKFLLANRFPQLLWWGPEFCSIYNDAYIPILGTKHPSALGRPVSEVWKEIWHVLKPLIETPFSGGPATWMEDIPLEVNRKGFLEETHFTIAYSPVPDETVPGGIGGVIATVHEITEKVVGERRVRALRDLGAHSVEPRSTEEACSIVRETLSTHSKDIPFLLLYLLEEKRQNAKLGCYVGAERGDRGCPESVDLSSPSGKVWPLSDALATEDMQLVQDLVGRFDCVPQGPWADAPTTAAVLPIRSNIQHQLAGFIVVGLSSRIEFDKSYRDFLELLSTQIATTIANARAYEEERKRAEALAEVDRAKTVFFSNVSHEFRTPLTLMLGPLEDILSESNGLTSHQQERLDIAHRNSLRLLKLVNTLLDFSRIEAGRFQACYEPLDLARLTSDLASVFRSTIEKAGLQFVVNCPSLDEPVYVDRELWEKIVFNLLSNAFKFTFEGEIEISVQKTEEDVELAVRDTGTGIPVEDLPHLFERFYRVKNARGRTIEGSGIGLALVEELVKQNRGTVWVESKVGVGTTFTVAIPLGKDHLPPERIGARRSMASTALQSETYIEEALHWLPDVANSQEFSSADALLPAHVRASGAGKRSRILLADDNADMREYVRKLLSPSFEVEVVPDGERALEAIRKRPPELILSDVMMPKLDGFGLLKELRSDHRTATIPFIMLSARAGEESRIEGVAAGAYDYLTKPFSARELLARVNSQLNMARMLRESNERNERQRRLYQTILGGTPDLAYVFDLNHRFTYANEALLSIWGKTWDEASGKNCLELGYEPWHAAMHDQEIEQVIATKKPIRGEAPFTGTNGRRIYDYIFVPVIGPGGEVEAIAGTTRDVTERKATEDALRQSEKRFRALVNATSYAVYRMSSDWSEMRQLEGKGFVSDTGEPKSSWLEEYIHPDDRQLVLRTIREAVRSKSMFELEHRIRRKDGSLGWTYSRAIPLFDHKGEIIEWFGAASDVTARKDAEERYRKLAETLDAEVRARTRDLEQRNAEILRQSEQVRELSWRLLRAQDEERRHIARELHDSAGQTLTVLGMNLVQLVQKAGRHDPELATDAETIQDMVQQLHREIRTASYLLHPPLLDENGLSSALTWYVQGLGERSGLQINLEISEKFGRLPRDMELVIFRLIQECLTNIHRHSGSKIAFIRIARDDGRIAVEIRDTGKGMSPERLTEIQSGGSGVGIRGMKERLRQFAGEMKMDSDSSGTRIFVTIPLAKIPGTEDKPTNSSS
jgi:PAS domain S-box-containing protein